ncbi:MAG: DUF1385 domain-containing protein [Ruminococcaceae bacterium]|nr:DUF1385 domain-containing protein [Oscillospiraceae bacterium]
MKDSKACPLKKTSIGGQALIEGVMMRGPERTAMAVRHVSGEMVTEEWDTPQNNRPRWTKWLFIRGLFNFVDSLKVGYKCLMRSAELSGLDEEESKPADPKEEKKESALLKLVMILGTVLGLALSLVLFMWLPIQLFSWLTAAFPGLEKPYLRGIFEGVLRILIFLSYMLLVSRMKDIRRTFQYHGAEHKSIFCYEKGLPLTVENVRQQRRFHPRCGTSFMILMLLVGIIISILIPIQNTLLRTGVKLLLLPLSVGVGYELIKLAGRHDNRLTRAISAPGVWMQHLTTKEPDDSMIECAITALQAVVPEDPESDRW